MSLLNASFKVNFCFVLNLAGYDHVKFETVNNVVSRDRVMKYA